MKRLLTLVAVAAVFAVAVAGGACGADAADQRSTVRVVDRQSRSGSSHYLVATDTGFDLLEFAVEDVLVDFVISDGSRVDTFWLPVRAGETMPNIQQIAVSVYQKRQIFEPSTGLHKPRNGVDGVP